MKAALFCLRTAAGESAGGEYGERGGREKAADLPSANSVFFSRTNTEEGPSKTATEQKIGKGGDLAAYRRALSVMRAREERTCVTVRGSLPQAW